MQRVDASAIGNRSSDLALFRLYFKNRMGGGGHNEQLNIIFISVLKRAAVPFERVAEWMIFL